jgi:S-adenosylmethionine:tRNA ribosyltransferase-isomerase
MTSLSAPLRTSDFDYDLPEELIAQHPLPSRTASRLMHVDVPNNRLAHQQFTDVLSHFRPGDLLVFNNTKVIPARLYGEKITGGKVECLIERILSDHKALAHVRASKPPKNGSLIFFSDTCSAKVGERQGELFELFFDPSRNIYEWLHEYGQIPLPPYIERSPVHTDLDRYQTVYAECLGAVAAPTAGLHFDVSLIEAIKQKGIEIAYVTLHVGAGTFQPVRSELIQQHIMHSEYMDIGEETCEAIKRCRKRQGRVIAVGTTVLRCLETVSKSEVLLPYRGETNIFIYPGYEFSCVDALITNFHLPQSTLLMLVSALAGYDLMMTAYKEAVAEQYRFFSYGDAMFIQRSSI